jgi:hypothetical protein
VLSNPRVSIGLAQTVTLDLRRVYVTPFLDSDWAGRLLSDTKSASCSHTDAEVTTFASHPADEITITDTGVL